MRVLLRDRQTERERVVREWEREKDRKKEREREREREREDILLAVFYPIIHSLHFSPAFARCCKRIWG